MNAITPNPLLPAGAARHDGWSDELRARFLSLLAENGNVRLAAKRCGMSAQSAYVQRRRDPLFAQGWAGALLLARDHAEQALADRAVEGVEEPIFYRGEQVGSRRRYDTRLLLAHLARLDRLAEDEQAQSAAARFDELLAMVAGEELPDTICPAADGPWPPARADFVETAVSEAEQAALDAHYASPERDDPDADERCDAALGDAAEAAHGEAGAAWDAWFARACARVDRTDDDPAGIAFKSMDPVNSVNFAARLQPPA